MKTILKRAAKLLNVKSIVTILMTVVFAALSLRGRVTGQEFLTVFSVVIAFYFGTQTQRISQVIDQVSGESADHDI